MGTRFLENTFYSLKKKKVKKCHERSYTLSERIEGRDCPRYADTTIGLKRLENIEYCFNEIIRNNFPGDFIEPGVRRGGATIFMKALLKSADINDRNVWVTDSFGGLPKPDSMKTMNINLDLVNIAFY